MTELTFSGLDQKCSDLTKAVCKMKKASNDILTVTTGLVGAAQQLRGMAEAGKRWVELNQKQIKRG